MLKTLKELLSATPRQYALYVVLYAGWGFINNGLGKLWKLAEFGHWWQVLTCYVLYLVPWSLAVRRKSLVQQYLHGLFALGVLELLGYALGTSIAHPDNVFDRVLGPRNFSLAMTLMFAGLLPAGNLLVAAVERALFGGGARSFLLAVCAVATAAGAAPRTYRLDGAQSEVVAITRPSGIGSGLSHAHVIEARGLSGELTYDAEAPERSAVQVSIPVASLVNDDPAARARHGLKDTLSDSDRKSIAGTIRSDQQLDAARFPTLSFKSTRVRALPDGRLEVQGALTIRGVSKEIAVPVQLKAEEAAVRGEGKVTIKHSDFGFKPVSLLFGAIANADEVELRIKLVGVPP